MDYANKPLDLKTWLDAALGFFYPQCCQICGAQRATPAAGYVCEECQSRPDGIRWVRPPFCRRCGSLYKGDITGDFECIYCQECEPHFEWAHAAVEATGLVMEVVHRYKYQRALWFEPFLAGLLVRRAVPDLAQEHWDCIVPVPLHPLRKREREFNQAERLAAHLAAASGIPLNARLLRRVENTPTQTMLTRSERSVNVRHAFAMRQGGRLSGGRLLLVDDVLTTGATTSACAQTLLAAGAETVCVWTVVRAV